RATSQGVRGLGDAADPLDGRADVRMAWSMPAPEPGPGEEPLVVGSVHQAGQDRPDAQPTLAVGNGCGIPLPEGGLTIHMGQPLRGYPGSSGSMDGTY